MQEPFGKTLTISFIGASPFVIYNPLIPYLGGSDILVTNILARKFGFIPKFNPAKSIYDFEAQVRKYNPQTYSTMLPRAKRRQICDITCFNNFFRLIQGKQS